MYWGRSLEICCSISPNTSKSDIGLPITMLLEEMYWETAGDALRESFSTNSNRSRKEIYDKSIYTTITK
jgi:hypothetical protein